MILVTGGTGFVGRRVVRRLLRDHAPGDLCCLAHDRPAGPREAAGRELLERWGVRIVDGELVSGRGLDRLPREPAGVVHLASCADTSASDHRVNDVGTARLLDAVGAPERGTAFIFTSSIAVSDHRADPRRPARDDTPLLAPWTDYGRRKLATERLLAEAAASWDAQLHVLRLGVVFGSGSRPGGFVEQVVGLTQRGHPAARLAYPGRIALTHVDDIAEVVVGQLHRADGPQLAYPTGEVRAGWELFAAAHAAIGRPYRPLHVPGAIADGILRLATAAGRVERRLPRPGYDRIWQAAMLAGDAFWCERSPGWGPAAEHDYRSFGSWIREAIGGRGTLASP